MRLVILLILVHVATTPEAEAGDEPRGPKHELESCNCSMLGYADASKLKKPKKLKQADALLRQSVREKIAHAIAERVGWQLGEKITQRCRRGTEIPPEEGFRCECNRPQQVGA